MARHSRWSPGLRSPSLGWTRGLDRRSCQKSRAALATSEGSDVYQEKAQWHESMYPWVNVHFHFMNRRDCRNHLGGRGTDSVGNAEKAEDLRGLRTLLMPARSPEDSIAIVIMSKIVIMKNHNSDQSKFLMRPLLVQRFFRSHRFLLRCCSQSRKTW